MISCDTNILFPAFDTTSPLHTSSRAFLDSHKTNDDFCLCEQVLMELYCLLRNPAVCRNPLSAPDTVAIIEGLRSNPHWGIVDVLSEPAVMQWVWQRAAQAGFAYRRIFDLRLAATLQLHRVSQFATRNQKDFKDLGFEKVWNPLK